MTLFTSFLRASVSSMPATSGAELVSAFCHDDRLWRWRRLTHGADTVYEYPCQTRIRPPQCLFASAGVAFPVSPQTLTAPVSSSIRLPHPSVHMNVCTSPRGKVDRVAQLAAKRAAATAVSYSVDDWDSSSTGAGHRSSHLTSYACLAAHGTTGRLSSSLHQRKSYWAPRPDVRLKRSIRTRYLYTGIEQTNEPANRDI